MGPHSRPIQNGGPVKHVHRNRSVSPHPHVMSTPLKPSGLDTLQGRAISTFVLVVEMINSLEGFWHMTQDAGIRGTEIQAD